MDNPKQIAGMLFTSRTVQKNSFQNKKFFNTAEQVKVDVRAGDSALLQWPTANGKRGFTLSNLNGIKSSKIFVGFKPPDSIITTATDQADQLFYRLNGQVLHNWTTYLGAFDLSSESIIFTYDSNSGYAEVLSDNSLARFKYEANSQLSPFVFYEESDVDASFIINLATLTHPRWSSDIRGWVN